MVPYTRSQIPEADIAEESNNIQKYAKATTDTITSWNSTSYPTVPQRIRQSIEIQNMLHKLESDLDKIDYSEVAESILKKADQYTRSIYQSTRQSKTPTMPSTTLPEMIKLVNTMSVHDINTENDLLYFFLFKNLPSTIVLLYLQDLLKKFSNWKKVNSTTQLNRLKKELFTHAPLLDLLPTITTVMAVFQSGCLAHLNEYHTLLTNASLFQSDFTVPNFIQELYTLENAQNPEFFAPPKTSNHKAGPPTSRSFSSNKRAPTVYMNVATHQDNDNDLPLLNVQFKQTTVQALLDTGTPINFIHPRIVKKLKLKVSPSRVSKTLRLVLPNKAVTTIPYLVTHQSFMGYESLTFVVFDSSYDFILGFKTLKRHPELLNGLIPDSDASSSQDETTEVPLSPNKQLSVNTLTRTIIRATSSPSSLDDQLATVPPPIRALVIEYQDLFTPIDHPPDPTVVPSCRLDIKMEDFLQLKNRPLNKYSQSQETVMREEITKLLNAGLIEKSSSPVFSSPSVVPKPHSLKSRLVYDYRKVNAITNKIPTDSTTWESLTSKLSPSSNRFTTLDLTSAFHLIPLDPESRSYTSFLTPFGKYQFTVLPFGLSDSPAFFSQFLQTINFENNLSMLTYMDDCLIQSTQDLAVHTKQLQKVFETFRRYGLKINLEKCKFFTETVEWLGHSIKQGALSPLETSISTLEEVFSKRPTTREEVRQVLGHIGFYQSYIPRYADKTYHLTNLLKKSSPFVWSVECQHEFDHLLNSLISSLTPFDPSKDCVIYCDSSNFACASVLLQRDIVNPEALRPVSYRAHKFNDIESRWSIHDKEFFAMVHAIDKFFYYIHGRPTTVYTDHQSVVQIFKKDPSQLSAKNLRWMEKIFSANVTLEYLPGLSNVIADHLSRAPVYHHSVDPTIQVHAITTVTTDWTSSYPKLYKNDPIFSHILEDLAQHPKFTLKHGLLYHTDRLCIPAQALQEFLTQQHTNILSGHIGTRRLKQKLRQKYYFPNYNRIIDNFVRSCDVCLKVKPPNHRPLVTLQSSDIPSKRWSHICLDFITGFPNTKNSLGHEFDSILTVVDKFSSRVYFIPTIHTLSTVGLLELLNTHIFSNHGFPDVIQSDRGPQMDNQLFTEFFSQFQTKVQLGVSHHQQSNGKVERYNHLIEIYLRCYVTTNNQWLHLLPMGQFTINSQPHSTYNGLSPFQVDLGYQPPSPIDTPNTQPSIDNHAAELAHFGTVANAALVEAQKQSKIFFDQHRTVSPPVSVGDVVYIDLQVLPTIPDQVIRSLVHKLRPRFCGPFTVLEKLSEVNYRLELPPSMKRDNVFHISQLRIQKQVEKSLPIAPPTNTTIFQKYKDGSVSMELKRLIQHQRKAKGYLIKVEFLDIAPANGSEPPS